MSTSGVSLVATPAFVAITTRELLLLVLVVGGGLVVTWLVLRLVLRETVRASGAVLPRRDSSSADSANATDGVAQAALFAPDGDTHARGHRTHHAHADDGDATHRNAGHAGTHRASDDGHRHGDGHHHGGGHSDSHDGGGGDSSGGSDGGSSGD